MRSRVSTLAWFMLLSCSLLVADQTPTLASDLASRANIFMYSKPMVVGSLVLRNYSGQTVSLADYKGKVVLLRFSSINCPACRMEEPLLEELRHRFGPAGLEILGVNLVDSPQAIAAHAVSNKTPFPVLFDGGGGFSLKTFELGGRRTAFLLNGRKEAILEVPGFPTTYILDCSGSAVGWCVGAANWNDSGAQALIQNLVGDRKMCLSKTSFGPMRTYSGR